ncbi:MAG: sugar phosphate isomerase/epimerase [Candidatus Methanoperedens sp.]|nr:sugar phosphate isomerase/epimerase [Candidatus Methanoperedens sp.]
MIIGASSFAGTLPELISEVDSIELYIPKLEVYEGTKLIRSRIKSIQDIISSYDISTSIHAPYFSDAPNYPLELVVDTANLNDIQERLINESIEIAQELGSQVVVIHPGRINGNKERSFENMVTNLSRIASFAQDRDVMLGLENKEGTDPKNLCISASELVEAIARIGSTNLQATFDIGHANLTCKGDQEKLRDFSRTIKDHIAHVHVHDNTGSLTEQYWGDMHTAPGKGSIDFSILKGLGFKGVYNLEVFSIEDIKTGKKILKKFADF